MPASSRPWTCPATAARRPPRCARPTISASGRCSADAGLAAAIALTIDTSSTASSVRKSNDLRLRLPLARLTLATRTELGADFPGSIADELNVREVEVFVIAEAEAAGFSLSQNLVVNARAAGPRLGKQVQQVIKASKTGDWSVTDGTVVSGGIELVEGEYS